MFYNVEKLFSEKVTNAQIEEHLHPTVTLEIKFFSAKGNILDENYCTMRRSQGNRALLFKFKTVSDNERQSKRKGQKSLSVAGREAEWYGARKERIETKRKEKQQIHNRRATCDGVGSDGARCIFGGPGRDAAGLRIYEPMYTNEVIPGHLTFQATAIVIRPVLLRARGCRVSWCSKTGHKNDASERGPRLLELCQWLAHRHHERGKVSSRARNAFLIVRRFSTQGAETTRVILEFFPRIPYFRWKLLSCSLSCEISLSLRRKEKKSEARVGNFVGKCIRYPKWRNNLSTMEIINFSCALYYGRLCFVNESSDMKWILKVFLSKNLYLYVLLFLRIFLASESW